jgi:hypothetical protein
MALDDSSIIERSFSKSIGAIDFKLLKVLVLELELEGC